MEYLFEIYENIQLFALSPKYRNYKLLDEKFHTKDEFFTKIQVTGYIIHKFSNPANIDINVDIYFFNVKSKYIDDTIEFRKLLGRYTKPHEILLITENVLDVYRRKTIAQHKDLFIKNYIHEHFIIELNRGPLCSIHTILSKHEANVLRKHLFNKLSSLPAISEMDPQNIWINGKIGDVIKVTPYSEISGETIEYLVVIPDIETGDQQDLVVIKKTSIEKLKSKDDKKIEKKVTFEDELNDEDFVDSYEEEPQENDDE
ncbi:MAG: DNA-directed RNA polymerase subunit RpoH/Rpb5 C-terminal domain-containing protein [Cetobacterium sp.]